MFAAAAVDREEQRRRAEVEAADELRRTEVAQLKEQAASACKNMQVGDDARNVFKVGDNC